MDAVTARIKAYVLVLYPSILTDLGVNDDYLNFIVSDVIDRALIIMNRDQLIAQYEKDLIAYPDLTADFWINYSFPIPRPVERVIAKTVVQSARTAKSSNTAALGGIKSVSDNGQSISYSDTLQSFFSSADESEVFSGSLMILKRYLIGTVFCNDPSI